MSDTLEEVFNQGVKMSFSKQGMYVVKVSTHPTGRVRFTIYCNEVPTLSEVFKYLNGALLDNIEEDNDE